MEAIQPHPNQPAAGARRKIKMNAAQQQVKSFYSETNSASWTDRFNEVSEVAEAVDQNWEAESTTFEFNDGSKIVFCGIDQSIKEA